MKLEPGNYEAKWFNANTGQFIPLTAEVNGGDWTSPEAPGWLDWALLIQKKR